MMAAGKKNPEKKKPDTPDNIRSLRDDAEEHLTRTPKSSPNLKGQTPEQLIHELQVHQVELETQAEELIKSKLALEESRDKFLDLYDFAPVGYLTLNDKALVTEANLACATLLGVDRSKLIRARFRKFVTQKDSDQWVLYFMNALNHEEKQACTLTLKREDGSVFPARLEGGRLTGSDRAITVRIAISDISDIWQIEALRESEEKFRLISESSPDHIFIQDRDLRYTWVLNPQLGLRPKDMIGKTDYDILSKEDADLVTTVKRQVLETRKTIPYETSLSSFLGETEYFEGVYLPKYDADGRINGVRGYFRNITGRKVAEEVLKQSELLFREVFNNANDAVFLLERTPEGPGTYLLVNDTAVRMLGYSREELLKMSPRDIVPEDIAKKIMPSVIKKLQNEGHATFESAHRRKDGSIYPIEVSTHTFHYKGKDVDLSIVRDITVRKRAEETIRQSEEKFRLVVENDPDAIFIQTQGQFAYVNPAACRLFGAKSADLLVGTPVLDRFHADFREIVKERIHVLNDERQPVARIDEISMRLDGTPFDVEVSAVPMTYLQKDGALVFFNDITERKVVEEALRESEDRFRHISEIITNFAFSCQKTPGGPFAIDWIAGAIEKITGYTADEISDMTCWRPLVIEEDIAIFDQNVTGLFQGESKQSEVRIRNKSGEIVWLASYTECIADPDNPAFLRLYGACRDITERKVAEETIRQSERKFRDIFEKSVTGLFKATPDGSLIDVNGAFARLYDYSSAAEMLADSKAGRHLYISRHLYANPEDRKEINQILTEKGKIENYETLHIKRDGTHVWVSITARTIRDAVGTVLFYEGTVIDITERKKAEEALRESEERFRLLLQHVPSISVQGYSMDGTTQYWNGASEILYGYTAQEAVGKNLVDLIIPPEMQDDVRKAITYMADSGQPIPASELSLMRKDGSRVAVFSSHAIVKRAGGGAELFCIDIDLTERKMAEMALQDSNELFTQFIRHSPFYTYIKTMTANESRILYVSDTYNPMTGLSGRDMVGKNATELLPAEVAAKVTADDWAVISNGTVQERIREYGGRHYNILKFPIVQRDKIFLAGYTIDITERKQAEEALRESEAKFRDFFNNAGDAIAIHDMQGRYLEVNDVLCRRLGYSREELLEMSPFEIEDPEYSERIQDRIHELQQARHIIFDTVHLGKDGIRIPTEVSSRMITYGLEPAVISMGRDITERKRAEKALRQANKKLTLLSSITRHDINNQLTVLRGYLAILEEAQLDPTQNEYFRKVSTAAKRISAMIQFTKEYEGIGVTAPSWQDTRTLVDTAAKEGPLGKVMVKNDLPAGGEVFADPLIAKVFYNLMDNAVRYGGKITTIRFSAEETGDDHLIVCEDDGDGVPVEEKEKIFERGFGKNTGLGLALSREILDITGITIRETGEPGKGARFEIVVPKGAWK